MEKKVLKTEVRPNYGKGSDLYIDYVPIEAKDIDETLSEHYKDFILNVVPF